ncbi:hypothetical protein E3E35_08080 [Thermococcus sp. GR7]|uniref:hypothetical protein n=1 Tax=unclassified Thermococcus TaxID=2627626 RepID=UPI00143051E0|nr:MULTISPECIES: hypothetical protein [unclassified Thermococcus]NJE47355.1 hypothetical protein [Thermococcus sp. GR7]NJE78850.1 hypothetical protein [Thermococcus sp. GR4]NJF23155.1 hypothetical protein [Thermococcus sp. GR5]
MAVTVNFLMDVDVFTKSVSGISVSPGAASFLAHTFREYGPSFTSDKAHTPNTPESLTMLTKTVSGVMECG